MALMEIDQVAVDRALWERAKAGDETARDALSDRLDDEVIYFHAMPVEEHETIVTLRELEDAVIVRAVTLRTRRL